MAFSEIGGKPREKSVLEIRGYIISGRKKIQKQANTSGDSKSRYEEETSQI